MLDNFKAWIKEPFRSDMDVLGWFYFFGLVIVISVLWRIALQHVLEGISE